MNDCVFCKIAKGETPCYKIYEDSDFMAFLDISPLNKGHMQVIPKKHYRWTWDIPNFGDYWEVARRVARGAMKALGAPMVEFLTHGADVAHAHIWVVPVYNDETFIDVSGRKKFKPGEMSRITAKIKENI